MFVAAADDDATAPEADVAADADAVALMMSPSCGRPLACAKQIIISTDTLMTWSVLTR